MFHQLLAAFYAPHPLLSALQLIEIFPGEIQQKLHYDQQFSNHGVATRGYDDVLNFIVAIDDFTAENGGTIVIPGSHKWPAERVPTDMDVKDPLVMKAGTACLFSGNLWHAGGANRTEKTRRAIIVAVVQPWLRTLENHFLSIPFPIAAKLDEKIQSLLGYSLHHPFLGQVDFGHPKKKLLELAASSAATGGPKSKL